MPNYQLSKEWEIIQGVTREPVKAQCAIVNMEVEGKSFKIMEQEKEPHQTVPLSHNDAKQLLLGAALKEACLGARNSGNTPDTQGGATAVAEPPSLKGKQYLVVTRSQQNQLESEKAKEELVALEEAKLPRGGKQTFGMATSPDAGVVSKFTPPGKVGKGTPTAGGVLRGIASAALGADAKSASAAVGADTVECAMPGTPPAGGNACDDNNRTKPSKEFPNQVMGRAGSKGKRNASSKSKDGRGSSPSKSKVGCNTQSSGSSTVTDGSGKGLVTGSNNDTVSCDTLGEERGPGPVTVEGEDLDICLPDGSGDEVDSRRELIQRQKRDGSLEECMLLAESGLRVYGLRQGVLVHEMIGDCGEECTKIVLPQSDRNRVLKMADDNCGHLDARKVRGKLNRLFTWPGMAKDIGNYVESCDVCLRANKSGNRPAKLQERPVVDEPFNVVAVDIVGPLLKGKGGAQYILAYACMATRWPEAILLRNVTASEVSQAFNQIVCRTGLPDTVLTDRGSVFTGKVFRRTCELFGYGQITTTPYHPQGDGVVEHLHGTLKPMLAKASLREIGWVKFLPMTLFVLRQIPHKDSGLSPLDLVYGFQVRDPLDLVYLGWLEETCDW